MQCHKSTWFLFHHLLSLLLVSLQNKKEHTFFYKFINISIFLISINFVKKILSFKTYGLLILVNFRYLEIDGTFYINN